MAKLPSVYANPINKKLNNVQETYRSSEDRVVKTNSPQDISKKINEIFSRKDHVYKSKVKITFKNGTKVVDIVGYTNLNLLTLDGSLIKITDILDIEKI